MIGGGGGPDLAVPLIFHDNAVSRTFVTCIPNAVSFFNGRFHTRDGKTDG